MGRYLTMLDIECRQTLPVAIPAWEIAPFLCRQRKVAMKIQVLGTGCARCKNANAEAALQEQGLEAEIEKVTAIEEIMAYQVFATPALVIDGSIKSAGRVPISAEIAVWVTAAAKQNTDAGPAHP